MVNDYETEWLPEAGEEVEIDWGLEVIQGRVKEAYASGSRPRAVVEINAGSSPEESVTVTVPLDSVRPIGSTSKWSRGAKYEAAVQQALRRVLEGFELETHPTDEPRFDMLARLPGGRALIIEVKNFENTSSARPFEQALRQLRNYLVHSHQDYPLGLLVVNQEPPEQWRPVIPNNIMVTTWRGRADDQQLKAVLSELSNAG